MAGVIIKTRNKMFKLILGLVLLLVIEFFVLGYFIGGYVIGVMVVTFLIWIWYSHKVVEPVLEMGEEAIMQTNGKRRGEDH